MQFFLVAALVVFAATALAQQKQVDLLGNPDLKVFTLDIPGGTAAVPAGVSASGEVVGTYTTLNGISAGFIRKLNGTIVTFSVPNSLDTMVTGVNDWGEVVGNYDFIDGGPDDGIYLQLGFRRSPDGTFTYVDGIGQLGYTQGINNRGQVTGYYLSLELHWEGFLAQPGTDGVLTSFFADPTPGDGADPDTRAMAINASGVVVGYYADNPSDTDTKGFVRQPDGTITVFSAPKSLTTDPMSINARGVIVGGGTNGAFLRQPDGKMVSLPTIAPIAISDNGEIAGSCPNSPCILEPNGTLYKYTIPGSKSITPVAMNTRGEVVGYYDDAAGVTHGFLLTNKKFVEGHDL
jgi:uncharacterized membrane protein